jgi:hypothetical protein
VARRLGSVLPAAAIVAASAWAALVGTLWGFTLRCDDTCGSPPPWRDDPNAWQWEAFGTVSIAGFVCALLFVVAVAARWKLLSLAVLVAWAALGWTFLTLLRDSGLTSHAGRGWAGLSLLVLAGLAAIGLGQRSARNSSAEY